MTTRRRDAVGAECGDVERTREANNPNFIVGDLHSESHYQTSVPRARYNYAGVAQQKCIELPRFLSLSLSLVLLSCFFFSCHSTSPLSLSLVRSHVLYLHAFRTDHLFRPVRTLVRPPISLSFVNVRRSRDFLIITQTPACFALLIAFFLQLTGLSLLMKITFQVYRQLFRANYESNENTRKY